MYNIIIVIKKVFECLKYMSWVWRIKCKTVFVLEKLVYWEREFYVNES